MAKKILSIRVIFYHTILLFCLFNLNHSYSQCAGSDNALTICDKELYNQGIGNPNGRVDLFVLLGGAPIAGGTWTDLNSSGGLNTTTGLLNTWQINQGGVYNYRYTRNGIPGCTTNTAIITITLGGYPGTSNADANSCESFTSVPLFGYIGSSPNPHFNGTWSGGPAGATTGNFFNPQIAGPGIYTLTYTVPSVGTCPARASTVNLTVHTLPNSGTPVPLRFCETDDFSSFNNYDLFNLLTGADGGGSWTENSGTNELSSTGDSFIDIQNIATTFGPGTYTFTYTVNASHPICDTATSNVSITIEPVADLNGATLVVSPNLCFNEIATTPLIGTITQGVNPIPNGTYNVTYVLTGSNSGSQTVSITFTGGVGSFTINPVFITNIGTTTVEVTEIQNPATILNCTRAIANLNDTFEVFENPDATDTQITVADFCIDNSGQIIFNDINSPTIELSNGTYTITFVITGPNGTVTNQTTTVTINNGNGIATISSSLTPIDGNYSITITNIQNNATGCSATTNLTTSFEVFPIPNAQTITVSIPDICEGNSVVVNLSGAINLPNGFYDLTYDISGAINATNQISTNVVFLNGSASFNLPNGILVNGFSTLTITNLINATSTCNTTTFNSPSDSFEIFLLPNVTNATVFVIEPICLGNGTLVDFNAPLLVDGTYAVQYSINGANTTNGTATVTVTGGNGTITIPSSDIPVIGNYTFTITSVTNTVTTCSTGTVSISDDFVVNPNPNITSQEIIIADICFGENATVLINSTGGLADGNYSLTYTLTGVNGPITQTENIVVVNGSSSFIITSTNLVNIGLNTVTIDNIANTNTTCNNAISGVSVDFLVNELPNFNPNTTSAADTCLNSDGIVSISNASNLSNGTYTITYNLSGVNTASNEVSILTITSSNGTFLIPGSLLSSVGTTTLEIISITNNATGCSSSLSVIDSFNVIALPDASGATFAVDAICITNDALVAISNANSLPDGNYTIVYDLSVSNISTNNSIGVLMTSGTGSFIIPNTLLTNSGSTTVVIQNIILNSTQCGTNSLASSPVTFMITDPETPTLISGGNLFCIQDNPTIGDLLVNTSSTGTITWYNSPSSTTPLNTNELLVEGTTYYATTTDANGCISSVKLEVTVDLKGCSELFIPDGFSPNGDGLNDTFYIKNLGILYPKFRLEIFNRYGNMVYKGDINTPDFSGQANQATVLGKDVLPTGVYFFVLYFNDSNNTAPKQGRLYLSR